MILSFRFILSSATVFFMVIIIKFSQQLTTDITLLSQVAVTSSLVSSWLRPLYLYCVINCIIITIFASSKFHQHHDYSEPSKIFPLDDYNYGDGDQSKLAEVTQPQSAINSEYPMEVSEEFELYGNEKESVTNIKTAVLVNDVQIDNSKAKAQSAVNSEYPMEASEEFELYGNENESVTNIKTAVLVNDVEVDNSKAQSAINSAYPMEVSEEFELYGNEIESVTNIKTAKLVNDAQVDNSKACVAYSDSVKANTEGRKNLGVPQPERESETLEDTWKAIASGSSLPITHRHTGGGKLQDGQKMIKFETFNQQLSSNRNTISETLAESSGLSNLRRDPSLGQDELNKRVEAFINRFKEDMRLQRKESLRQYVEMINSSAY